MRKRRKIERGGLKRDIIMKSADSVFSSEAHILTDGLWNFQNEIDSLTRGIRIPSLELSTTGFSS